MRKNIEKVIQLFVRGESGKGDSKGTCWTDGKAIYSYNMLIAKKALGFTSHYSVLVIRPECAPSKTTRSQVYAIMSVFPCQLLDAINS